MKRCSAISLFAGIGGICLGLRQAGFDILWADEKNHAACLTYGHHFGCDYLVEDDIRTFSEDHVPQADVLAAGFPCQSFLAAGAGEDSLTRAAHYSLRLSVLRKRLIPESFY